MRKRTRGSEPSCPAIKSFQEEVYRYFNESGRRLPWRNTRDPYRILISEVMLQTEISVVKKSGSNKREALHTIMEELVSEGFLKKEKCKYSIV
jgi:adenine-specific DNA glycosylase